MGTYSYTGTIRFVTVQTSGVYDITGYGGAGGASSSGTTGGNGAEEGSTFTLTAGEKLEIVVGGAGAAGTGQINGGAGGGGTFVFANTGAGGAYVPLLVAGGGGGGYRSAGGTGTVGAAGTGNGGAAGGGFGGNYSGGGGAGVKGAGATGGRVYSGGGGSSAAGGFAGGAGSAYGGGSSGKGGFAGGGGGGAEEGGGGGGGGYTGGDGGYLAGGLGGTSFDAGTAIVAVAGQNAGTGKLVITPNVTCFATGTAIRVLRDGAASDVAVEDLAVGDVAVTASGAQRAIRWIGSRDVVCAGFDDPRRARPIRIAAHAFSENVPARRLRVSPGHALAVTAASGEEVLVPAFAFLNGATVVQESVDTVTYWHVELDGGHDILLAEGLPAESYLDCGNRGFFAGDDGAMNAGLDAGLEASGSCHWRSNDADTLRPTRARLRERALALGWRLDAALLGSLRLIVDGVPVLPDSDGLAARFLLPASAKDVWLVSAASVPWDVGDTADGRRLGLCLGGLAVGDGLSVQRAIALDDPRLGDGFHLPEDAAYRWTDGRARLDPALWAGCRGYVFLRLALARPCLPAWRAPQADGADLRVA